MEAKVVQLVDIALASRILVAILVNLKEFNNKRQLFVKATYDSWQSIFYTILIGDGKYLEGGLYFKFEYLQHLFVFSVSDHVHFCPVLQATTQQLQFAEMICWPDTQESDLMRLNPNATDYYQKQLLCNTSERLAYQDVIAAQEMAKMISKYYHKLIVDRHHLMNLPA